MSTDATADMPLEFHQREFLPLRKLAGALIILLACTILVTAAELKFVGQRHATWGTGTHTRPLVVISVLTAAATAIVFLIWFRRARINAERLDWRQRRVRGWAFWGWIVPIVNLWIPFQIMGDIWRAGLPPARRARTAWLPVLWWVSWLLSEPLLWIQTGSSPKSAEGLTHGWLNFVFFAIAGLALMAIIHTVSDGPVGDPDPMTDSRP